MIQFFGFIIPERLFMWALERLRIEEGYRWLVSDD
jgi:hypothetical protein